MKKMLKALCLALPLALWTSGCQPTQVPTIPVSIVADGQTRTIAVRPEVTVNDALREAGLTVGGLDRVNPPGYTRLEPGATITLVRVVEEQVVVQQTIPFERMTTHNDGLATGETRLLQAGVNGTLDITYRVIYEDGVEISRTEVRQVVTTSPQSEIVMVGSQGQLPAVTVNGALAYISSGNAWMMRGNSTARRLLTIDGGVDGRVFQLSPDGKQLLLTRSLSSSSSSSATPQATASPGQPFNSLWIVLDTTNPDSKPVRLRQDNVLFADFLPGNPNTIVYSTGDPRPSFPGWQANNDLWTAKFNTRGIISNRKQLVSASSGGIYGWYGSVFAVSPDGSLIAWSQADAVGILKPAVPDPAAKTPTPHDAWQRQTLLTFAPRNAYDFVWAPAISWSPDGALLATTVHGAPLGSEAPQDSPVYSVTLLPSQGGYAVDLTERSGMWSAPQFSPSVAPDGTELDVMLAYLNALDPLDSARSKYQLVLADRDGSNATVLFPDSPDQPGLAPQIVTWSPDGRQIALIYQGNLYLIDVETGLLQQLTQDGLSSVPRWRP